MSERSISEFSVIDAITRKFPISSELVAQGIGDDCSIVHWDENHYLITSTDLLIEDIHFKKSHISPEDLGWKSLAVSYSDLAAMGGGEPLSIYLSLGCPATGKGNYIEKFFDGMKAAISSYGGNLLGGDTSRADKLIINILVQGKIKKERIKKRSMARKGDIICVTRKLGDSEVGLKHIIEGLRLENVEPFLKAHHHPFPQLKEAGWLAQFDAVHAMIDISDGLYSDLLHICKSSQVRAEIDLDKIPLSHGKILESYSFCEEYCLLFTVDADQLELISKNYLKKFGQQFYPIGKVLTGDYEDKVQLMGNPGFDLVQGFDHFLNL